MKRREFITLLGGAAPWPLAVRAQKAAKVHRIFWASTEIPAGPVRGWIPRWIERALTAAPISLASAGWRTLFDLKILTDEAFDEWISTRSINSEMKWAVAVWNHRISMHGARCCGGGFGTGKIQFNCSLAV